jgi:hypothetical protein
LFPAFCAVMTPEAPTLETHSLVLHSTNFFVRSEDFFRNPFVVLPLNLGKLAEYAGSFLTWPATAAALAAAVYMAWRRSAAALILLGVSGAALLAQMTFLVFFPTRYPFPQTWPLLLVLAMALADLSRRAVKRNQLIGLAAGALLLVGGPMLARSLGVVCGPGGSDLAVGRSLLLRRSRPQWPGHARGDRSPASRSGRRPLALLVDPIWGLPADGAFPYLNHKHGIRVFEAWWNTDPAQPLLPAGEAEVVRSHYERVAAETVNFRSFQKVFYLTTTSYHGREEVQKRAPGARLHLSIPKGDGTASLDLWRLR